MKIITKFNQTEMKHLTMLRA